MALDVEDGTGKATANSYISEADLLTYHAARGNAAWAAATSTDREGAAIRAADYMVQKYRTRWKGKRYVVVQRLDWPRSGVVLDDQINGSDTSYELATNVVPEQVKEVQAQLALRALSEDLWSDLARGGLIASRTVGPISTSYFPSAPGGTHRPSIDGMLAPFLESGGGVVALARA